MWLMGQYGVAAVTKYACFMPLVVAADAASLEMKGSSQMLLLSSSC